MKEANRRTAPRLNHGFTLIELMIAIAILAILVALAVPAYQDYSIRAKVTECINNAAVAKVQISEFQQSFGAWPATADQAAISASGFTQFCNGFSGYNSADGSFTIALNHAAIDPLINTVAPRMIPTITATGNMNWNCVRGATDSSETRYLPGTCRDIGT